MSRLSNFISRNAARSPAVATAHAENAVWRAERLEWEAAMWEAGQAAQADPVTWEDLPSLVRQARERAYECKVGWDGITYRPEE